MLPLDLDPLESELQSARAEIARLREHNDLLTAVISHSPATIYAKDVEGRLMLCNRAYERSFPHVQGGYLGKLDQEIFDPEAAVTVRENDRAVRERGVAVELEEVIPQVDGLHTYISIKFPLYDHAGKISGVAGISTDITERKRIEGEHVRLQQQVIEVQRATLSELSTPIIPLAEGIIAMPLVGAVDGERARLIMHALLDGLATTRAHTAIVDITGVRTIDMQVAHALHESARAARLLGAAVIITGVRPDAARTLVGLDTDWSGIETLGTLQAGVAVALARAKRR